jgi:hypothetical protein
MNALQYYCSTRISTGTPGPGTGGALPGTIVPGTENYIRNAKFNEPDAILKTLYTMH